jgi:hypothetical protein
LTWIKSNIVIVRRQAFAGPFCGTRTVKNIA